MPPAPANTRRDPPEIPGAMRDITGFLVNALAERLRNATEAALGDTGVRPRQLGLLLVLADEGAAQQQHLGERLGMDRTTTMQLVALLEADGLLVRTPDPSDGRAWMVTLTPRGTRVARTVARQSKRAADTAMAGLTPGESAALHSLLRKALGAR